MSERRNTVNGEKHGSPLDVLYSSELVKGKLEGQRVKLEVEANEDEFFRVFPDFGT